MTLDTQSLILIAIGILIPVMLLLKNNTTAIVTYFCITMHLDILSYARNEVNFTYLKFFAIVSIPFALKEIIEQREALYKNNVFKGFSIFYILILCSCVYFGIIHPWADSTGVRSTFDSATFKSLRQLLTITGEFSLGIIMAQRLKKFGLDKTLRCLVAVTSVCFFGIILERFLNFDFYHFVTQGKPFLDPFRARGFNYEPRGLSNTMALACMYAFFYVEKKWAFATLILAFMIGNFAAISMVGNILMSGALVMMITFSAFYFFKEKNKNYMAKTAIFACYLSIFFTAPLILSQYTSIEYFKIRLAFQTEHYKDRSYVNDGSKSFIQRLEVHDAAAMNFLKDNPLYSITGVGLGTMGIASSPYILPRDRAIWGNRSDNNPHMGGIFLLSQYGLIGCLCLLYILFSSVRKLPIKHVLIASSLLFIWVLQLRYGTILIYALLFQAMFDSSETPEPISS